MIHLMLLFFGVTFIYAGILMMRGSVPVGVGSVLIGLLLSVKPLFYVIRLGSRSFGTVSLSQREWNDKKRRRRSRSKFESDEKPTYH